MCVSSVVCYSVSSEEGILTCKEYPHPAQQQKEKMKREI
jgi:hypothetical protein